MVKLLNITPNYLELLQRAAGVCHNKQKAPPNVIQHIIESGHLSVLEHATATFEIEISRKVLAQITRHRHLSFTVQSSRVCKMFDYVKLENYPEWERIEEVLNLIYYKYQEEVDGGTPLDIASYLLPEATMCRVIVTGSFRTWLEMIPKRTCKRALKEFRDVANEIYDELMKAAPEIFTKERRIGCKECTEKSCDFK